MDKICEMKMLLESQAFSQMGDLKNTDTKELGEVVDMIKDLAEAEYYCKAVEAMNGAGEELEEYDRMGYNTSRYNNGHYAPKGSGHYSPVSRYGFRPMEENYLRDYIHDPVQFREDMRMGYHEPTMMGDSRHGRAYADWDNAKRHYTATHDTADKEKMNLHTNEHVSDFMVTVKEMYMDADPNLRVEMKAKLQQLLNDMK